MKDDAKPAACDCCQGSAQRVPEPGHPKVIGRIIPPPTMRSPPRSGGRRLYTNHGADLGELDGGNGLQ